VLLSQNVQSIPHTRDWVVWESGVAKSRDINRDIWVFEPIAQQGTISVVIPFLRHYVLFATDEVWFKYIRAFIESYDDSHVLPTVAVSGMAGAGLGAIFSKKGEEIGGAILGGLAGVIGGAIASAFMAKSKPVWQTIICFNCQLSYNVYIPSNINSFRCPSCNTQLRWAQEVQRTWV